MTVKLNVKVAYGIMGVQVSQSHSQNVRMKLE